jgi:hypothetical protein
VKRVRYVGGPLAGLTKELSDDQIPWAVLANHRHPGNQSPTMVARREALDALADRTTAIEVAGFAEGPGTLRGSRTQPTHLRPARVRHGLKHCHRRGAYTDGVGHGAIHSV